MPQGFFSNSFLRSWKLPLLGLWNPDPRDRDLGTNFLDLSTKVPASCLENPTFRGPRVLGAKRFSLRTKVPFGCLEKPAAGAIRHHCLSSRQQREPPPALGVGAPWPPTWRACSGSGRSASRARAPSACRERERERSIPSALGEKVSFRGGTDLKLVDGEPGLIQVSRELVALLHRGHLAHLDL